MSDNPLNYGKLLLYSVMPAYEEAWLSGYSTACADGGLEENPYQIGDSEFTHWEDGWWSGFYQEKPLVEDPRSDVSLNLSENSQELIDKPDLDELNPDANLNFKIVKSTFLQFINRSNELPYAVMAK